MQSVYSSAPADWAIYILKKINVLFIVHFCFIKYNFSLHTFWWHPIWGKKLTLHSLISFCIGKYSFSPDPFLKDIAEGAGNLKRPGNTDKIFMSIIKIMIIIILNIISVVSVEYLQIIFCNHDILIFCLKFLSSAEILKATHISIFMSSLHIDFKFPLVAFGFFWNICLPCETYQTFHQWKWGGLFVDFM